MGSSLSLMIGEPLLQAEYARMMEAQERAREEQLAKARAWQAAQAADAEKRPGFKKWMDPEIIEHNARCGGSQNADD